MRFNWLYERLTLAEWLAIAAILAALALVWHAVTTDAPGRGGNATQLNGDMDMDLKQYHIIVRRKTGGIQEAHNADLPDDFLVKHGGSAHEETLTWPVLLSSEPTPTETAQALRKGGSGVIMFWIVPDAYSINYDRED